MCQILICKGDAHIIEITTQWCNPSNITDSKTPIIVNENVSYPITKAYTQFKRYYPILQSFLYEKTQLKWRHTWFVMIGIMSCGIFLPLIFVFSSKSITGSYNKTRKGNNNAIHFSLCNWTQRRKLPSSLSNVSEQPGLQCCQHNGKKMNKARHK